MNTVTSEILAGNTCKFLQFCHNFYTTNMNRDAKYHDQNRFENMQRSWYVKGDTLPIFYRNKWKNPHFVTHGYACGLFCFSNPKCRMK